MTSESWHAIIAARRRWASSCPKPRPGTAVGQQPLASQTSTIHDDQAHTWLEDTWHAPYCRQSPPPNATLLFELDLERNLWGLYHELVTGSYLPGRSICFVITRPKAREVWAAAFRDRIVHHLLYNRVAPRFDDILIPVELNAAKRTREATRRLIKPR